MGSLTASGVKITQSDTKYRHQGSFISLASITGASSTVANTSQTVERQKFTAGASSSGNLEHDVTRKFSGIHVSVSHREAVLQQNKTATQIASGVLSANALGPMETITERKVFFIESDRGKSSSFADWTIYSASGVPVGENDGTTDTDITPNATYDQ